MQDNNTITNVKRVFSAMQPTGMMTIGNYLGAVSNWVSLQDEYDCFYAVADLHSLTLSFDAAVLRQNTTQLYAMLMACGIDIDKACFFVQSHVVEHSQLAWILNCYTQYGEARRMTQFKDKSSKNTDNVNVGLFGYPILQAADILLYSADFVPIGQDQKQHLELSRVIADRFNNRFSPTFVVPQVLIPQVGGKINSLVDPNLKMSKSDDNPNSYILMTDDVASVERKIKRAVTDSEGTITVDKARPGITNLVNIYACFGGMTTDKVVDKYKLSNYETFKKDLADLINTKLQAIQTKYNELLKDKVLIQEAMTNNAKRAKIVASRLLSKVHKKIGL